MKRILIILVVAFAICTVAGLTSMNSIVAAAVEKAGTKALGVETTLDDADIGLMSAEARLSGLAIANPEGFGEDPFLSLGRVVFDLRAPSLFESVIQIPLIELEGTRLSVVQRGQASNIASILSKLEAGSGGGDSGTEPSDEGEGKRFLVERIVLKQVEVAVSIDLLGDGSNATTAALVIPEVLVENVGTSEEGAQLSTLVGEVVKALLSATLDADGGSILDGTLRKTLEDGLAGLEDKGRGLLEDARGSVDEALEGVDETIKGAEDALGGAVEDAKQDLEEKAGDLLRGIGGKKD